MNWVALADWVAVARFLLDRGDIAGPVNVTAPHPVSNAEFTAALAAAVHRPALLAVPVPALRLAAGGASSELLSSARVMPHRLLAAGYEFAYPDITEALAAELSGDR
jgi:NAD dependent epimerase/dehydratase family enzyme